MALKKYKMHMVVANELLTHKDEVVVVTSNEKILVCHYKTQVGDVVENPLDLLWRDIQLMLRSRIYDI